MNTPHGTSQAIEVRRRLADPGDVCSRLGIDDGARRQRRGLLIRCPWHADRTPSCSVREADDETIAVKCFGCGASGDVLDLVAICHGVDVRGNFAEVLRLAGDMAGVEPAEYRRSVRQRPRRESAFPPEDEVRALWESCRPVLKDAMVCEWLASRTLDAGDVETLDVARALHPNAALPTWARFQGRGWGETGHRCLVPVFDDKGAMRSVRARRVEGDCGPKTLPPTGYRTSGLVMADPLGRQILATGKLPDFWPAKETLRIVVAEGEPDFLTWATAFSEADLTAPAVIGVVSGSWTDRIARLIPDGSRVIVRTHHDDAGEAYAQSVFQTFAGRRVTYLRGGARNCSLCAALARGAA